MSAYEELWQFVAVIAYDAQSKAAELVNYAVSIDNCVVIFNRLTSTSSGNTAKTVDSSLLEAQKQILIAANALFEAAKAGSEWCGSSVPELKLVLKPKRR